MHVYVHVCIFTYGSVCILYVKLLRLSTSLDRTYEETQPTPCDRACRPETETLNPKPAKPGPRPHI